MTTLTANPWILDMVCYCVGGAAMFVGIFLLWRALFADRARGRRRCPKCWYDMAGAPALRCSECGNAARNEARLARTRRHWRAGLGWALVMVLGLGGVLTPRVVRWGPEGVVPTTLLAWWGPVEFGPGRSRVLTASASQRTWRVRLEVESWRRLTAGNMWDWQARAMIERWLEQQELTIEQLVLVPQRWRAGERMPVDFIMDARPLEVDGFAFGPSMPIMNRAGLYGDDDRVDVVVSRSAGGGKPAQIQIRDRLEIYVCGIRVPMRRVELTVDVFERGAVLEGLDDATLTETVRVILDPRIVLDETGLDVIVGNRRASPYTQDVYCALSATVRVMVGERCLGIGTTATDWKYGGWKDYVEVAMAWEPGSQELLRDWPELATIEVTGRPDLMEQSYIDAPFLHPAQGWTGSFVVPVRVESVRDERVPKPLHAR